MTKIAIALLIALTAPICCRRAADYAFAWAAGFGLFGGLMWFACWETRFSFGLMFVALVLNATLAIRRALHKGADLRHASPRRRLAEIRRDASDAW